MFLTFDFCSVVFSFNIIEGIVFVLAFLTVNTHTCMLTCMEGYFPFHSLLLHVLYTCTERRCVKKSCLGKEKIKIHMLALFLQYVAQLVLNDLSLRLSCS